MRPDTIAAVATPPGSGALAVIRVSGPDALAAVSACVGRTHWKPRMAALGWMRDVGGAPIDQVLATWFPSPASFTGEDVVEVSCHGGMLVTRRVLERILACGVRPAEAGEFSYRAFLNGKMDLTQAEAVMDVISAGGDLALRAAQHQLEGAIGARVSARIEELVALTARVEACIDFPDEAMDPGLSRDVACRLIRVHDDLGALLGTADCGRLLREGIRTVIVGPPNVGKSSLLNALLGYERAIVSGMAGTTRDTIEERVQFGGLNLRLVDTAGLRDSSDPVERAGMERSRRAGAEADLLIEVADASCEPVEFELPSGAPLHLLVLNKADLGVHPAWRTSGRSGVEFSCTQALGRDELECAVIACITRSHHLNESGGLLAVNARHCHALRRAIAALDAAGESLKRGDYPELTAFELREALECLGTITGRVDTEDILDSVFSQFCLGK